MVKDRLEEKVARELVADELDATVTQYDDGSKSSMVDALIDHPDGRHAAMEIIGDHDGRFYALWRKLERVGHEIEGSGIQSGWLVVLYHRAKFRDVYQQLPGLLVDLEHAGLSDLRQAHRAPHWPLYHAAENLGVRMAYAAASVAPGTGKLRAEGWSGISGSTTPAQWVADVLADNPDVAAKLAAHEDVSERHAFIWSTIGTDYAVQFGLEKRDDQVDLDQTPPELPDGVTHVWIAGSMSSQGAIAWSPGRGWWRTAWTGPSVEALAEPE
ncbi:hypothetical protein ACLFMI_02380 [Pseudonocardia nantongensis]|uniref:hypothetical protein n=1 Tax=Pseudonocardia nantongensis TaxID=1181885 RepID=UPI00397DD0C1